MASPSRPRTVALIGNPNTGKSTLFNGLVGVRQHVGNYPGVTVEKKTGHVDLAGCRAEIVDLPGLYSLAARAHDEMVVVDLLLGRQKGAPPVDAVVCIADASNLERSLYLLSQVLELELPTVLAVNMLDVAERHGIRIDLEQLERRLGIPVVPIQANRRIGLPQLKRALTDALAARFGDLEIWRFGDLPGEGPACPRSSSSRETLLPESPPVAISKSPNLQISKSPTPLPAAFEAEAAALAAELPGRLPRWLVRRLLLDSSGYLREALLSDDTDGHWLARIEAARSRLAAAGCPTPAIETSARYGWARETLDGIITESSEGKTATTDKIDRVLTHRFWGTLVFAVVMLVMFQSVFVWARPISEGIQRLTAAAGGWVSACMAEGRSAACWSTASSRAPAPSSPSSPKFSYCSPSSPSWRTAATWPAPPTSWTG